MCMGQFIISNFDNRVNSNSKKALDYSTFKSKLVNPPYRYIEYPYFKLALLNHSNPDSSYKQEVVNDLLALFTQKV